MNISNIVTRLTDLIDEADISNPVAVPQEQAPKRTRFAATTTGQLYLLNCMDRPGLTKAEFKKLFTMCTTCHRYTTRDVFFFHVCEAEIIDLTDDGTIDLTDDEIIDLTDDEVVDLTDED